MLTPEQKQERLKIIAEAANRFYKMKAIKEKSKNAVKAAKKPLRKKAKKLDYAEENENEKNIHVWGDAEKYVKTHYASNYIETTRYDNEWN